MIKLTLEYDNKKYSVEIPEPKEEVGELCKKCEIGVTEHPHTPLEVKEGSKDIEPTFTLSVRCEEGVEGCTRLGYHSHTSKNREGKIIWETGKENDWYMRFLHGNNILEVNLESLLSQQEAKIKKELVEEIENIMKGMSPILFFGDSKNHLSDVEKQKIVLENALSNIKKLLSE